MYSCLFISVIKVSFCFHCTVPKFVCLPAKVLNFLLHVSIFDVLPEVIFSFTTSVNQWCSCAVHIANSQHKVSKSNDSNSHPVTSLSPYHLSYSTPHQLDLVQYEKEGTQGVVEPGKSLPGNVLQLSCVTYSTWASCYTLMCRLPSAAMISEF